jgi:hypothetical protein
MTIVVLVRRWRASLPGAIVGKLNHDILEVVRTEVQDQLRIQGPEAGRWRAEFACFIAAETTKLNKLIETASRPNGRDIRSYR